MSGNIATIDIEAITGLVSALDKFEHEYERALNEVKRQVEACNGEWSDEDFDSLSLAVSALSLDASKVQSEILPIKIKAQQKLELIRGLYGIKI